MSISKFKKRWFVVKPSGMIVYVLDEFTQLVTCPTPPPPIPLTYSANATSSPSSPPFPPHPLPCTQTTTTTTCLGELKMEIRACSQHTTRYAHTPDDLQTGSAQELDLGEYNIQIATEHQKENSFKATRPGQRTYFFRLVTTLSLSLSFYFSLARSLSLSLSLPSTSFFLVNSRTLTGRSVPPIQGGWHPCNVLSLSLGRTLLLSNLC